MFRSIKEIAFRRHRRHRHERDRGDPHRPGIHHHRLGPCGERQHRTARTHWVRTVYIGHEAKNLEPDVDAVVYSSAVRTDENPETIEAQQRKIPVIRRAEMLAEVMRLKYGIGIAGTHGKTTTTSMVSLVLMEGGVDPTVIVGGRLHGLAGSNARMGKGEFIVVEADEYDRSFLSITPTIAVLTTLETDHLDCYRDLEDIKGAFIQFANKGAVLRLRGALSG